LARDGDVELFAVSAQTALPSGVSGEKGGEFFAIVFQGPVAIVRVFVGEAGAERFDRARELAEVVRRGDGESAWFGFMQLFPQV
jgi:hypothetical protein